MISQAEFELLKILQSSLFEKSYEFSGDVDLGQIITEAKAQTVLGLISEVIDFHEEQIDYFKANYIRIMYEQDKVLHMLGDSGVPCVIIKGSSAAIYYSKPYLRAMGDIDVLVSRDRFNDATRVFEANGYLGGDAKDPSDVREVEYLKNGIPIELHHHFSSAGVNVDSILESAITRCTLHELSGYKFPVLPDVENGLVLLGHINQHLKNNVLGLRQIIDWAMYIHTMASNESWKEYFLSIVNEVGLTNLAAYVTRLCNLYLGLPEVIDWGKTVDDDLVDRLMEIILTDGNFGRRADIMSVSNERNVRSAYYEIIRFGFFSYFISVGLSNVYLFNKYRVFRPLAFFYGLFRQLGKGIITMLTNKKVYKQLVEGRKRFVLYKKVGVRMKDK